MDVNEIRNKRYELKIAILKLMVQFEKETSMSITGINFIKTDKDEFERPRITDIEIIVRL